MAQDVFGIVGSVIAGAYHVEKVVAEGGFGVVYRAHHGGFRAPVALKCLKVPQHLTDQHQATFLEQFRAEAELLFRLSASIVTVVRPLHVDAMTTPDGSFVPFMVLEWLEGETLDSIIRRRTQVGEPALPVHRLIQLLTPVARALEKAHHFAGPTGPVCIVHRDLKPENIFVARLAGEEVVKILDFGIGKVKSVANQVAGRASQEAGGLASFTPAYGAPEQWVPKKLGQTGPWTDVWGLALTMVEAMVGRPVIDGDHQAIMGTVLDTTRRPTPRSEGLELSNEAEAVFNRALAVDPRDRFSSAGDFWNQLQAAFNLDDQGRPLPRKAETPTSQPRIGSVRPGRGSQRPGPSVPTVVAGTAESALALDMEPHRDRRAGSVSETRLAAVGQFEIPDLDVKKGNASSPFQANEAGTGATREFEEAPASGIELALDLPDDDAFARRSAPPSARSSTPPHVVSPPAPPTISAAPISPRAEAVPRHSAPPSLRSTHATPKSAFRPPLPELPPEPKTLVQRILPGLILVGASILLTIIDQAYSAATSEMLTVGSLRATWIAAILLFIGIGLIGYRLVPRD